MARGPGFKELQAELNGLAQRVTDARPVLREVAQDYRDAQDANFARGGRPKWKPLTPAYAARKAATGHGTQIGVFSGGLRDSLIHKGARYNIEKVDSHELQVGTRNPVANLMNGRRPKRKVQTLTPTMRREFLAKVQTYLAGEP